MDLKVKDITESFTINLGEITSKFEHERQERIKLRDEPDILKAQVREPNTAGDTTVQTAITSARKIVIKRLPIKPDDDNATTLTMVHAVLTEVDTMYRFTITDMHRVPGTRDRGVPPIIITMEDESQVKHIMKNKRVLAQSSSFTRVYIEPDKARDQRWIDENVPTIVQQLPNLSYRGGRTGTRGNDQRTNTASSSQVLPDHPQPTGSQSGTEHPTHAPSHQTTGSQSGTEHPTHAPSRQTTK